jgi:hypothetical protein
MAFSKASSPATWKSSSGFTRSSIGASCLDLDLLVSLPASGTHGPDDAVNVFRRFLFEPLTFAWAILCATRERDDLSGPLPDVAPLAVLLESRQPGGVDRYGFLSVSLPWPVHHSCPITW